jgi:AhpD family alkylhydroperoxidase
MSVTIPAGRLALRDLAARQYAAMSRLSASVELDERLRGLIDVRASQLNGCAFCIDMHWKDARAFGETEERLYMLSTWHESPAYSERERLALGLCEAMTRIADADVSDELWDRVATAFDAPEQAQLVFAITVINAWNRLCITSRAQPGFYEPGMLDEPGRVGVGR